jgi:hypothetical protein
MGKRRAEHTVDQVLRQLSPAAVPDRDFGGMRQGNGTLKRQ